MDVQLAEIFNLNHFSSGRRAFALRMVRYQAKMRRYRALVERIDKALAYEETVRELDRRWRDRDRATVSAEARPIDNLLNRTLTAIRDTAAAQAEGARPGDAIIGVVERFLDAAFPGGVLTIVRQPYINKLASVEDLHSLFEGELAGMVEELGLGRLTRRLAELAGEYRRALESGTEVLRFDTVREARERGQNNLLEVVALIAGRYYKAEDGEHAEARAALLAPILEQQEAIRAYIRARRSVRDVDPDTGEPVDEPADEIPGEAAPAGEPDRPAGEPRGAAAPAGESAEETAARVSSTAEPAPAPSPTPAS